jgi:hypothetical protein
VGLKEQVEPRKAGAHLQQVPVPVACGVRPEVAGHLGEQELALRRAAGARHPRGRAHHHGAPLVQQPVPQKRVEGELNAGGIAPGVRHQPCLQHVRRGEVGHPVHRALLTPGAGTVVGGEVDDARSRGQGPLSPRRRLSVWKAQEDQVHVSHRRLGGSREGHSGKLRVLPRPTLRGGEADLDSAVPPEQAKQLQAGVPCGSQDPHGPPRKIMHIHRMNMLKHTSRPGQPPPSAKVRR